MEQVINAVSKAVQTMELKKFIEKPENPAVVIQNLKVECREYVAISSIDEIFFIKMENIIYCKSEGRFTKFYMENGDVSISSKNIGDYDERVLDPTNFFRIHNSYIINMKYVNRIVKIDGISCEMKNGLIISISKRRQDDFNKFIKLKE